MEQHEVDDDVLVLISPYVHLHLLHMLEGPHFYPIFLQEFAGHYIASEAIVSLNQFLESVI